MNKIDKAVDQLLDEGRSTRPLDSQYMRDNLPDLIKDMQSEDPEATLVLRYAFNALKRQYPGYGDVRDTELIDRVIDDLKLDGIEVDDDKVQDVIVNDLYLGID